MSAESLQQVEQDIHTEFEQDFAQIPITISGVTLSLDEWSKVCPIPPEQRTPEANGRYAIQLMNDHHTEIPRELYSSYESYFTNVLEEVKRPIQISVVDSTEWYKPTHVERSRQNPDSTLITSEQLPVSIASIEKSPIPRQSEDPGKQASLPRRTQEIAEPTATETEIYLNDEIVAERAVVDNAVEPRVIMESLEPSASVELPSETKHYLEEVAIRAGMVDDALHIESTQVVVHETTKAVDTSESFASKDVSNKQVEQVVDAHLGIKIEQDDMVLHEIRQEVEATFDPADYEVLSKAVEEQEAAADESASDVEPDALPDYTLAEHSVELHDEAVEYVMLLVEQALAEQDGETWRDELPEALQNEPAIAVEVVSIDAPDLVLSNVKHAILAFEAEASPEESEQMDMLFAEMTQITEFLTELQSRDIATAAEILESQPTNTTGEVIEHMPLNAITKEQLIARLEIVCERMLVMLDAPHDREHVQVMVHQLITLIEDREAWDKSKALTPEELAVMGTREYKLAFRHQQSSDSMATDGSLRQIGATALAVFRGIASHGTLVPARA